MAILCCAMGGAAGALMRYWVSGLVYRNFGTFLPWGTLAVNLLGSLCIGVLWAAFESLTLTANLRMFLMIGFFGAFTTFSTFALENFLLIREGQMSFAIFNILLSNLLGIGLVFAGYFFTRSIVNIIQ